MKLYILSFKENMMCQDSKVGLNIEQNFNSFKNNNNDM